MLLSELKKNQTKRILQMNNPQSVKNRLNNMGLIEGVKVTLVRIAPFGCPFEIKVRDFYLAIRKSQAEKIVVGDL